MPMFQRAGMREEGKPLPLAFQYLIFIRDMEADLSTEVCGHCRVCPLIASMEVKNKYAYVITQDICSKSIEVFFLWNVCFMIVFEKNANQSSL